MSETLTRRAGSTMQNAEKWRARLLSRLKGGLLAIVMYPVRRLAPVVSGIRPEKQKQDEIAFWLF